MFSIDESRTSLPKTLSKDYSKRQCMLASVEQLNCQTWDNFSGEKISVWLESLVRLGNPRLVFTKVKELAELMVFTSVNSSSTCSIERQHIIETTYLLLQDLASLSINGLVDFW